MDVVLADLVLEGLKTRDCVVAERNCCLLEHTEEVDVYAEEGVEDVADIVEMFLDASGGCQHIYAVHHEDPLVEDMVLSCLWEA